MTTWKISNDIWLKIDASGANVTRTAASKFTVSVTATWQPYYSSNKYMWGVSATTGGKTSTLNPFGTKSDGDSKTFTGTYSINSNTSTNKSITVTFKFFNSDTNQEYSKDISFSVTVPAWTSYAVSYNANGGSGAPAKQTKWKDQDLTLSKTIPTRTGYAFQGWGTSTSDTTVDYKAGASYTDNAAITLYAIWKANAYTVSYNANGGSGAPGNQTKTYGATLTLSKTVPLRSKYNFKGWGTSVSDTTVDYSPGGSYTANAAITLYAIWESAYADPTINNLSIKRCDAFGVVSDDGTCILVNFDWTTYQNVTSIRISWVVDGIEEFDTITTTGTSGAVTNQVMGQNSGHGAIIGKFDPEISYEISVTVTDGGGSTTRTVKLRTQEFPIDVLAEGKGVAFGKAAELEGVADFGWQARFNGGILHPVLKASTDLNDVIIPNTYVGANVSTYSYGNCPITSGTFTLEVIGCGEDGQVKQRITSCHKTESQSLERFYYGSAWGEWVRVSDYNGELLWSGGYYMTSGHTITLSELVSKQRNGIVLVFSEFVNGAAVDQSFHTRFIPKMLVSKHSGKAQCIQMSTSNLDYFATKYLYVYDDKITGHDNNNLTITGACGIICTNNRFVLRYVIGV